MAERKTRTKKRAVLFLGSGATKGSGIKKGKKDLPADSNFFKDPGVTKLLNSGAYPCLKLFRDKILKAGGFEKDKESLFHTWNALFILRGLMQSGIVDLPSAAGKEFRLVFNKSWPCGYEFQKEHYGHQFEIRDRRPDGYFLCELAIWDLRVLVKDVYGDLQTGSNKYQEFWRRINQQVQVSAVVNFNYDTTFDDSLSGKFYYPGDAQPDESKKPLIRPHGSLKWKSVGRISKTGKCFVGWTSTFESIDLKNMGYKSIDPNGFELALEQPLIVPPSSFKEEVVGNSSLPGLCDPILWFQWQRLHDVIRAAEHWVFYGFSFASGDDHLKQLLRSAYGQQTIHCQNYAAKDEAPKNLRDIFRVNICKHKISKGDTIEKFLKGNCKFFK